jgi:hypothetical protein
VIDDGRGPLRRVDLGEERDVDEPGVIEQLIVRPGGILAAQVVTDGIVLAGEEGVQHRQPDPEPRNIGRVAIGVGMRAGRHFREAVSIDAQFAVDAGTDSLLELRIAAVDLRAIPPVRLGVDVGRRRAVVARETGGVLDGA